MPECYRVNGPNIVSDVIDDEVFIINLEKGIYYSLMAPGVEIWEALRQGATLDQVQEWLLARFDENPGDIARAVHDLVREMEAEHILVRDESPQEGTIDLPDEPSNQRRPFQRPVLHRYTDMEAILMLDPIHEVDQQGWPSAIPER
jgi:hypothetical protein